MVAEPVVARYGLGHESLFTSTHPIVSGTYMAMPVLAGVFRISACSACVSW